MSTTAGTRTFETTTHHLGLTSARTLLAPTTALYTLPFGLYYLFLSHRIIRERHASSRPLGHGQQPSGACPISGSCGAGAAGKCCGENNGVEDVDPLYVTVRSHANFAEHVPMGLLMAALAELNGGDRRVIGGALAVLFGLRVAHVECGMRRKGALGHGRAVGYFGTQLWLAGMAGYCACLVKDWMGGCCRK